jgi:hypothetical protein
MGSGGIAPRIPCLNTRWISDRLGVPAALNPSTHWIGGQVGTRARHGRCGEENNSVLLSENGLRSFTRSAHSLVTILPELYRISPSYT